jgi:hypothetical protein
MLFKFLTALGFASLLNLLYYLWLERDLDFVYGVIYSYYAFSLLPWIYPYAFLTVRDRHWLTRSWFSNPQQRQGEGGRVLLTALMSPPGGAAMAGETVGLGL